MGDGEACDVAETEPGAIGVNVEPAKPSSTTAAEDGEANGDGGDDVSCPVCLEPYWEPSKACPCGHIACRACFDRVVVCPLCRSDIDSIAPCGDPLRTRAHQAVTSCSCCSWRGTREEQAAQGHVVCPVECGRQAATTLDVAFSAYEDEQSERSQRRADEPLAPPTPFLRQALLEACHAGSLHLAVGLVLSIHERLGVAKGLEEGVMIVGGGVDDQQPSSTSSLAVLTDLLFLNAPPPTTSSSVTTWEGDALHAAAVSNNSAVLRELLRCGLRLGPHVDTPFGPSTARSYVSMLECALECSDTECARMVVSSHTGRFMNNELAARFGKPFRPLHLLVSRGNSRWLEMFVSEFGFDVNGKDWPDSRTALILASEIGAERCVRELIRLGADVDIAKTQGGTATFYAAMNGHLACLQQLLHAGANVNTPIEKVNATPLFIAAECGHMDCVEALLGAGADIEAQFHDGATALYIAAQEGHVEIVKLLHGRHNAVATGDQKHNSAFAAAARGHLETVRYLVEVAGVDVTMTATNGGTALMLAAAGGHTDVIEYLLQPPFAVKIRLEDTVPNDGSTALLYAIHHNKLDAVKLLLERGANPFVVRCDGSNAVFVAAAQGNTDILRLLLELKVPCDMKRTDTNVAALYMAAQDNHTECVRLLVAAGADIDATQKGGFTPLFAAAAGGHIETIAALIELGADVELAGASGRTPLWIAAHNGHQDAVLSLIKKADADIDAPEAERRASPLIVASYLGDHFMVRLLATNGADMEAVDCDGQTALFVAVLQNRYQCVVTLLEHGADVNGSKVEGGAVPLVVAVTKGLFPIVRALIDGGAWLGYQTPSKGASCLAVAVATAEPSDEIVTHLLDRHIDVTLRTHDGQSALWVAMQHNHARYLYPIGLRWPLGPEGDKEIDMCVKACTNEECARELNRVVEDRVRRYEEDVSANV